MHTDSYFFQGKSHDVCQDYATHTQDSIIVCDGCSSSPDTDFGARILARTILSVGITFNFDTKHHDLACILNLSQKVVDDLYLSQDCLYSTILYAQDNKDTVDVLAIGDGTIVIINEDNSAHVIDISFESGAPRYLNYLIDEVSSKSYERQFGTEKLVQEFNLPCLNFQCDRNNEWFFSRRIDKSGVKAILLMSDGVHSFSKTVQTEFGKSKESVSYVEVIKYIVDFKGYGGRFVQRRMSWLKNKDMEKLSWSNYDDFSVSAIFLGAE